MRLLCCIDSNGKFKLPKGIKKNFDYKMKELMENISNWRTGKNKPRQSTIDAMRDGYYGDCGVFTSSLTDAIEKRDIAGFAKVLNNELDRVYGGFDDGLAAIHDMDGKICEYLISGDDKILAMLNLPPVLKTHVKDFITGMKFNEETICSFYLYFWICIENHFPPGSDKPFQTIFAQAGETLYDSFVKLIRAGIQKRKHKMAEIHEMLNMEYKEFDNRLRSPSRFCNSDFLKRFADAYYELCFSNENKRPNNAETLFITWNTVAHAVWTMDKAKQLWKIDFRNLAAQYYDEFATSASS